MKHYVIWLILIPLCCCEVLDYSDYYPDTIPLRAEDPSTQYKVVMDNLCKNWHSPLSYLKKRGYMTISDYRPNKIFERTPIKSDNYFFFPEDSEDSARNGVALLDNEQSDERIGNVEEEQAAQQEEKTEEKKNTTETTGLINKVKDKFLNIFGHKEKSEPEQTAEPSLADDPELFEYNDDYDFSERKLYTRSITESPTKAPISANEGIFSNLTDVEINFIKSFISWFKLNKEDFKCLQLSNSVSSPSSPNSASSSNSSNSTSSSNSPNSSNSTSSSTSLSSSNSTNPSSLNSAKSSNSTNSSKTANSTSTSNASKAPNTSNSTDTLNSSNASNFSNASNASNSSTASNITNASNSSNSTHALNAQNASNSPNASNSSNASNASNSSNLPTTSKAILQTECFVIEGPITTSKPSTNDQESKLGTAPKGGLNGLSSSKSASAKEGKKDNIKDFSVDLDINQKTGTGEEANCSSENSPLDLSSDKNQKFITKSSFLAHLHHMVDEVGKPPRKPLDLVKVQDIIDKSKQFHTVTMAGGKTTECAPLRLNDMSFDLEWNKMIGQPQTELDLNYQGQPEVQSLAAKFLQDVKSYPEKGDQYLNTPYADNFLDSQQSLPSDLEIPYKMTTKREVGLPIFPDIDYNDELYYSSDPSGESSKRRIKGRIKGRRRNKKIKHKKIEVPRLAEPNDDDETVNDFNTFEELKDIQFRVNEEGEEAISNFISSLNSPPEVFSFDVDKYLRSARQEMEPKVTEYDHQPPEQRTFYEFLESPAVENERLPLIEPPSDESVVGKQLRGQNKRDLLRQYIKGVSNALSQNNLQIAHKNTEEKCERSSNNLDDADTQFRTNKLIDGFSMNLDAMNAIKSDSMDLTDDLNNFYLLNDGSSPVFDDASAQVAGGVAARVARVRPQDNPTDYSPQSLEIDLDLNKKFQDLNIGRYDDRLGSIDMDSINRDAAQQDSGSIEHLDHVELNSNEQY